MSEPQNKLSPKQFKFCHEYVITGNATEAAIKAGYSKNTAKQIAAENLTKPYLQEYIQQITKELEDTFVADEKEILKFYTSMMRDEKAEPKDRIKAADSLAKAKGMFIAKIDVKADIHTKKLEDFFK